MIEVRIIHKNSNQPDDVYLEDTLEYRKRKIIGTLIRHNDDGSLSKYHHIIYYKRRTDTILISEYQENN